MVSSAASLRPLPKIPEGAGKLHFGAIVFNDVDLIDVMGPIRIYGDQNNTLDPKINFLATGLERVESSEQVKITPDYIIADAPKMDILLLPGGPGSVTIHENPEVLNRVKTMIQEATWCFTVYTGARILAATGLADGYNATTNKALFEKIISINPKVNWIKKARWVQDGKYVTSSGAAAGIDAALYVISELASMETAESLATNIEYTWHKVAEDDPFADLYPYTRF